MTATNFTRETFVHYVAQAEGGWCKIPLRVATDMADSYSALEARLTAQPVRDGQEGKADQAVDIAHQWAMASYNKALGRDFEDFEVFKRQLRALYASQPDPAAEIAENISRLKADLKAERRASRKNAADAERAESELAVIREALELYREAVRTDVKMEGPQFMGANSSALKRAWLHDRAALANTDEQRASMEQGS